MPTNEKQTDQLAVIKVNVVNNVLAYLATKPYNEVAPLIAALQQEAKVLEPSTAKAVTDTILNVK